MERTQGVVSPGSSSLGSRRGAIIRGELRLQRNAATTALICHYAWLCLNGRMRFLFLFYFVLRGVMSPANAFRLAQSHLCLLACA